MRSRNSFAIVQLSWWRHAQRLSKLHEISCYSLRVNIGTLDNCCVIEHIIYLYSCNIRGSGDHCITLLTFTYCIAPNLLSDCTATDPSDARRVIKFNTRTHVRQHRCTWYIYIHICICILCIYVGVHVCMCMFASLKLKRHSSSISLSMGDNLQHNLLYLRTL